MTESPFVDSGFVVPVFSPRDDLIACLNKAMAFLTVVASSRVIVQQVQGRQGQSYSSTGYKSNATSSGGNNTSGQARVVKCYNCQDGQAVQTFILNNVAFQTEDLDTYDSDCDDISNAKAVLLANICNYGSDVISEVPHSKTYFNDMDNQRNIDYEKLNRLSDDFGKRFTPQQELSAEQAFWLRMSNPTSKPSDASPVKIEAPKGLPKLEDKDNTICKLKDIIKYMREKSKEENGNYDYGEIETKNVELENSVAKLISENEHLCNEINHVKQVFKEQFDSIKKICVRTKEHSDSLIDKLNLKSTENEDLKAQIQDKAFVDTSGKLIFVVNHSECVTLDVNASSKTIAGNSVSTDLRS
ncbi:hypothetical protein Tco_0916913 [Tanacetum coccineum]